MFAGHKLRRRPAGGGYELDYAMTHGPVKLTNPGTNPINFTSVGFGDSHAERMVVICVTGRISIIGQWVTSATIGGVSATVTVPVAKGTTFAQILWAKVPTGTSGTVALTMQYGTTTTVIGITAHRFNTAETTAIESYCNAQFGTPYTFSNIECAVDGIVFAVHGSNGTSSLTHTWNGIDTRTYDTGSVSKLGSIRSRVSHTLITENSTIRDMTYVATASQQGMGAIASFAFS